MFPAKRIRIIGTGIYISKSGLLGKKNEEYAGVLPFDAAIPTIHVLEDDKIIKEFVVETLSENPNLTGQYLHISIRILKNEGVMLDGITSNQKEKHPDWQDKHNEGIRFQPFFLSTADPKLTKQLIGKGLFERGLHYPGTVTPTTVRLICVCDYCNKSFTIQHFHGGLSESQYFYSEDSKQTLIVGYGEIKNVPTQLQTEIDAIKIDALERELPKPTRGNGHYRYYNSFCCPHCLSPYIDFQTNKKIRPNEYYGNKYINDKFYTITDHQ